MKANYDTKTYMLYIQLSEGKYDKSEKVNHSVILDISSDGKTMGIEILDASEAIQQFKPSQFLLPS